MTEQRHALVTGGGTGIGAAVATALARSDHLVTICGRRLAPLQALAETHQNLFPVQCDVTVERQVGELFSQARAARGPIRIVVANAGAADSAALHRTDCDLWRRMLDINLTGTFLTVREALSGLLGTTEPSTGRGRIICIASNAGLRGYRYVAAYSAAKHGVIGLVRSAALEVAGTGITVNAICPGFTATPLLEQSVSNIASRTGTSQEGARASMADMNPGGKLVRPEEIAATVSWLVGADSDAINGQAIEISGGNA